jgi:transposase
VTLQLLWEEYRDTSPDSYGYSRYVAGIFMLRDRLKAMTVPSIGNVPAT